MDKKLPKRAEKIENSILRAIFELAYGVPLTVELTDEERKTVELMVIRMQCVSCGGDSLF